MSIVLKDYLFVVRFSSKFHDYVLLKFRWNYDINKSDAPPKNLMQINLFKTKLI